jgi:hypothetical protein
MTNCNLSSASSSSLLQSSSFIDENGDKNDTDDNESSSTSVVSESSLKLLKLVDLVDESNDPSPSLSSSQRILTLNQLRLLCSSLPCSRFHFLIPTSNSNIHTIFASVQTPNAPNVLSTSTHSVSLRAEISPHRGWILAGIVFSSDRSGAVSVQDVGTLAVALVEAGESSLILLWVECVGPG